MARFGVTGRAAATYITLAGLQRGVSLLILPFVTRVMPVSDYGAASTLSAAAVLVTSLMAAPQTQLIVRAAARNDHVKEHVKDQGSTPRIGHAERGRPNEEHRE